MLVQGSTRTDRMASGRMRRVDEAVRAVLSETIATDLRDPRVGFITVTGVKTSPDLRHARVYVSVLGDEQVRSESLDGLRSAQGFLQSRVATELRLRHTPLIEFDYDETVDRAMRLSELMEEGSDPDVRPPEEGSETDG
jgi:ribosome-binding factor A